MQGLRRIHESKKKQLKFRQFRDIWTISISELPDTNRENKQRPSWWELSMPFEGLVPNQSKIAKSQRDTSDEPVCQAAAIYYTIVLTKTKLLSRDTGCQWPDGPIAFQKAMKGRTYEHVAVGLLPLCHPQSTTQTQAINKTDRMNWSNWSNCQLQIRKCVFVKLKFNTQCIAWTSKKMNRAQCSTLLMGQSMDNGGNG